MRSPARTASLAAFKLPYHCVAQSRPIAPMNPARRCITRLPECAGMYLD